MDWKYAVAMVLVISSAPLILRGQVADAVSRRQILATDDLRMEALRRGDAAALRQIYVDDYSLVTPAGVIRSKTDQINELASGRLQRVAMTRHSARTLRSSTSIFCTAASSGNERFNGSDKTDELDRCQGLFSNLVHSGRGKIRGTGGLLFAVRRSSLFMAIAAAVACTQTAAEAGADEIRVLSAVGMRQVVVDLAPKFERGTGHRLLITFDSGAMIVRRLERGESADVLLVPHDAARQLALARKAVASSITELASSRVGVAVRAGAPRPDISSPEAFKQTLLKARSIARPDPAQGGSSGLHIQSVLERLGIADAVATKTILSSHPEKEDEMPAHRVARGDAEIALHQIQELLAVRGVSVVGPFPGDLDAKFLFSAILVSGTAHEKAGQELIAFLGAPEAKAEMRRRGMEPVDK